jgi:1-acyl-sn-glycerol-3-phosphate acyltransferase
MTMRDKIVGMMLCWFTRTITGAGVRWVNCLPSSRQRVYYANHSSHLDILLIWTSLPGELRRNTRPVAARDYWGKSPLRRYLAKNIFNVIMIDRPGHGEGKANPYKSIEDTLEGIGDKYSLIIFPEGTRGEGEEMSHFKGGIYSLAKKKPALEFIPVYLENLNRILPKGEFVPVPLVSSISFGEPVILGENENKKEFLDRTRQAVVNLKEIA